MRFNFRLLPALLLAAPLPHSFASAAAIPPSVRSFGSDSDGSLAYAAEQARRLSFRGDPPALTLRVDASLPPRQSRILRDSQGLTVLGDTPREVLQGVYRLEDLLRTTNSPSPSAALTFTRLFSPRLVHSGYGAGEYPDEHLDEIARAGMDGVILYLREPPNVTRTGPMDLSAFARRARRHGLDTYLYLDRWKHPLAVNPNDATAETFYTDFFEPIVQAAPELKGLILVGESVPFPSREKAMGSFWPVSEWTRLLEIAVRATRRHNSNFDILFWTYSWAKVPASDRLALLEAIPTNVTLNVTFELGDASVTRNGRLTQIDDYSITQPGPSDVFRSEAAVARRRGVRLTAMTCTGGRTWDFGGAPFVPVFPQWIDRLKAVRRAREEYGIVGLMDSHAFGFRSNPVASLANLAFTAETTPADLDAALARYAQRTFGSDASAALAAFAKWSEGFRFHSSAAIDQYGVYRIGATYPLVFYAEKVPAPPPDYAAANKKPGRWAYLFETAGFGQMDRRETEIALEWAEREFTGWREGNNLLAPLVSHAPDPSEAQHLLGVGRYCEATARTLRNLRRYQLLGPAAPAENLQAVLNDETQNVQALQPLVERDSTLGFDPNMRRIAGPDLLRWKLRQLDLRMSGPNYP